MIEKELKIKADDGKDIIAVHAYAEGTPADKIVILAHGLTGHKNEYIHLIANEFFVAKGYHVVRFDFYNGQPNTRLLEETTLEIQGQDLNKVVNYVKLNIGNKAVYVCGHSYGGATLLFAQPDATALAFWDSSFNCVPVWENDVRYDSEKDFFYFPFGTRQIVGKAMVEEGLAFNNERAIEKAKTIKPPSSVINADSSWILDEYGGRRRLLFESLTCPKKHVIIDDCDHCFTNRRRMNELLEATHDWFKSYS